MSEALRSENERRVLVSPPVDPVRLDPQLFTVRPELCQAGPVGTKRLNMRVIQPRNNVRMRMSVQVPFSHRDDSKFRP